MNLADRLTEMVDQCPPADGADFVVMLMMIDPGAEILTTASSFVVFLSDGSRYVPPSYH